MATIASTSTGHGPRNHVPIFRTLALFGVVIILAGMLGLVFLDRPARDSVIGSSVADTPPAATAVAFFSDRVASNPDSFVDLVRLGEAYLRRAQETSDASAYARAGEAAERALALNPDYPAGHLLLASSQLALHEFQAALVTASPLTESRNAAHALAIVFDAQLALGDYAAAETSLARLQSLSSGPSIEVRAAGLAELRGDVDAALKLAEGAFIGAQQLGLSSASLAWFAVSSAELHLRYGRLERAEERFSEALALVPEHAPALAGSGRTALAKGDVEDAVEWLSIAAEIAPQPEFLIALAEAARLAGDAPTEARAVAQLDALVTLTVDSDGLSNRALALYLVDRKGDLDLALQLAEREAGARSDVYTFDTLASVLLARGDLDDAAAASKRALALGGRDPLLLYHAALVRVALSDEVEARQLLEQALELNPTFHPVHAPTALELLAQLT